MALEAQRYIAPIWKPITSFKFETESQEHRIGFKVRLGHLNSASFLQKMRIDYEHSHLRAKCICITGAYLERVQRVP